MGIMLSLVTATSTAFSFTFYIIGITCCIFFNLFKVHRACIDFFLSRWAIESVFPMSCILMLVNIIVTTPSVMLYTLSQGWQLIFYFILSTNITILQYKKTMKKWSLGSFRCLFLDNISPKILILNLSHGQHIFQFFLDYLFVHLYLCKLEGHVIFNQFLVWLLKLQTK